MHPPPPPKKNPRSAPGFYSGHSPRRKITCASIPLVRPRRRLGLSWDALKNLACVEKKMAAPEMGLVDGTTAGSNSRAKYIDPWRKFHLGCFGRVNKELLVFKLYYFFLFSAQACAKPFLPVFFREVSY